MISSRILFLTTAVCSGGTPQSSASSQLPLPKVRRTLPFLACLLVYVRSDHANATAYATDQIAVTAASPTAIATSTPATACSLSTTPLLMVITPLTETAQFCSFGSVLTRWPIFGSIINRIPTPIAAAECQAANDNPQPQGAEQSSRDDNQPQLVDRSAEAAAPSTANDNFPLPELPSTEPTRAEP